MPIVHVAITFDVIWKESDDKKKQMPVLLRNCSGVECVKRQHATQLRSQNKLVRAVRFSLWSSRVRGCRQWTGSQHVISVTR